MNQYCQNFHNVDRNNYIYKTLFSTDQHYFTPKICGCCDEFLKTKKAKRIHNFLKYYPDGKNEIFENKPLGINQVGNKKTYENSVNKDSTFHNFEDAEWIVNDFLINVRSKFRASSQVFTQCGFSLKMYIQHQ